MLEKIIEISKDAGNAIMQYYCSDKDNNVVFKKNGDSPLTAADLAANNIIIRELKQLTPYIPILSEEGRDIPYEVRKTWQKFWLVDPLDGTKEFLKQNGEFTVNIALIENKLPVLGVIYVPAQNIFYYAEQQQGSYKLDAAGKVTQLKRENYSEVSNLIRVVGSRSHSNEKFDEHVKALEKEYSSVEMKSVGSSLKFCLVAENEADQYPRFGPTMEWDTAAGHAIAKFSGYNVLSIKNQKELSYNKESLLNDEFIVL